MLTAGEWKRSKKNGRIVEDPNGKKIATAANTVPAVDAFDNARLIESSKDLLDLAKRSLEFTSQFSGTRIDKLTVELREVISRVEGGSDDNK